MCVCVSLTVCVHSNDEVISHGFGLPQLVGVAVVHHVVTAQTERTGETLVLAQRSIDRPGHDICPNI